MRLKRSMIGLFAVAVFITCSAFACNATAQKILNKVASENLAFERAVTKAHADKVVTDEQERDFLNRSKQIAQIGNSASAAFLAGNNAGALDSINQAIGVIDDAINNGLLGVKNPDTKTALSAALLLLRGSFTTAKGFIPGGVQ